MAKYAFNHDGNDYSDVLGIPEERVERFHEKTKEVAMRAAMTDRKMDSDGKAFEFLLNELQPETVVEAILIGRLYSGYFDELKRLAKKIAKQIK